MTYYTKQELEMLESWIAKKVDSMDTNKGVPPHEYSEANLSRAILRFVQYLVRQEHTKQSHYSAPYTTDPYISGYNITPHNSSYTHIPPQYTVGTSNNTKTICDQCEKVNPGATHCVHRVTSPLKY